MPTTVHIPKALLSEVDRRARAKKVSRNRFIIEALEKELARENEWSPGFLEAIGTPLSPDAAAAFQESMDYVIRNRTSKKPFDL